jgi:hypothetical protein
MFYLFVKKTIVKISYKLLRPFAHNCCEINEEEEIPIGSVGRCIVGTSDF